MSTHSAAQPSGEIQHGVEKAPAVPVIPEWRSPGNKLYCFSVDVERVTALC